MTNLSPELNLEAAPIAPSLIVPTPPQRTALFESHLSCGGKIVPFAGWDMPVQYVGVKAEVAAVRDNCGLFDVSHMGQLDVRGENATAALNAIVSADWSKIRVGRAAYALLLTENGGVLDDIMGYHLSDDHWMVVVNASRVDMDEAHIGALLPPNIELSNRSAHQAMIAVQGPQSEKLLQAFCEADLSTMAIRDVIETQVLGQNAVIARGGYTGCDGFEWMGDAQTAPLLWQKLMEAGAVPAGLGARDVLRLEAGLPLYGHELREDLSPDESGVAFAVKAEKSDFFGRAALLHKRENHQQIALCGLKMEGRAIAREGYEVQNGSEVVGVVTSGTPSPTLDANIALALLPTDLSIGNRVEVLIRGTAHAAQIVDLPFVPRTTKTTPKAI